MISVDNRKLESIYRFVDFLEAISDPIALKKQIEDLRKASEDLKATLALKGISDNAESFLDKIETEVASKKQAAEDEGKALVAKAQAVLDEAVATKAKIDAEVKSKQAVILSAETKVKEAEALQAKAENLLAKCSATEVRLASKEVELTERQVELDKKAAAVKALLG